MGPYFWLGWEFNAEPAENFEEHGCERWMYDLPDENNKAISKWEIIGAVIHLPDSIISRCSNIFNIQVGNATSTDSRTGR